ncbi:hypothetical protein LEP1GSC170_1293 [Leptospira interrogans serovar Bataviae str. HAI135]|nr:hypothetical protein LEP1GSC170_1293 [Leptospira interrogans serovar Bataviae str. HAI135]
MFTDLFDFIGRTILGSKYGKKDASIIGTIFVHILWIILSLIGAMAWISYFANPYEMINDIRFFSLSITPPTWIYFTLFLPQLCILIWHLSENNSVNTYALMQDSRPY